ncbi:MAG: 7-carboxy-7-deazaguanine synthase QueE [Bacteroidales bacterium]|jgi:organic radical activating enzyme|nr:7-carboxy-7-deazaguanine synthase QueE [Bacteroidales bacterium]
MKNTTELLDKGWELPLMEAFYSLQGEGFHTGKAAYFLRIGGCDVGCNFCDVKEAWNAKIHPLTKVDDMIKEILPTKANTVVVTGGEPCLYNLNYLCESLKRYGLLTHIETSGSAPLSGVWDWICFSPKNGTDIHPEFYERADELKVIIETSADFVWAEYNAAKIRPTCQRYLQPEWSRFEAITPLIVDYILKHPLWKISLQSHKYMKIP